MPNDNLAEPPPRPRRVRKQIWDDAAFRKRCAALSAARGETLRESMEKAGLAVDYAYNARESRHINHLMMIAAYYGVPLQHVLGLSDETQAAYAAFPRVAARPPAEDVISAVALKAVLHHAERWLFLALLLNRPDIDPQTVANALKMDMDEMLA
jgi:hypothetical protein